MPGGNQEKFLWSGARGFPVWGMKKQRNCWQRGHRRRHQLCRGGLGQTFFRREPGNTWFLMMPQKKPWIGSGIFPIPLQEILIPCGSSGGEITWIMGPVCQGTCLYIYLPVFNILLPIPWGPDKISAMGGLRVLERWQRSSGCAIGHVSISGQ